MPSVSDQTRRRRTTPSKGDLRERAILDVAELQLAELGADAMTVEGIARAAGITRGALYFYFGSKNDVLAALVERTVVRLRELVVAADAADDAAEALRDGVLRTAEMWRDHGSVMRAAVELSPTVPAIRRSWHAAVDALAELTRGIVVRGGLPDGGGPTGAQAVTAALVWMTERTFYQAWSTGGSLDDAATTLTAVWLAAVRPPD